MYMLFKHTPEAALDKPFGIHVSKEGLNALCVFSGTETSATARDAAAPGYYMEAVAPDHVLSLAALYGVGTVAMDAYTRDPIPLIRAEDAVKALDAMGP
jgi:hypothetical protein